MTNHFEKERTGTGTQEWAEINFNIAQGCPHGCLYCYARANAMRFNKIKSCDEWNTETINLKAVNKKWSKKDGVIMFPTTHDITPANIDNCITALTNILTPGNKVLIVSKPHFDCIKALCSALDDFKDQMLFRFTIGSTNSNISSFWEPGAPTPSERIESLKYAFSAGFQTSVSMEPMLGGTEMAIRTYYTVAPWVTDTIWIGKMNKIRSRVDISNPEILAMLEKIEELQCDEEIMQLVTILKGESKVRWKESIKKVINA